MSPEVIIASLSTIGIFCAVPLFIKGLYGFKHELRRAYMLLCIGMAMFALSQLQLPLIQIFELEFWVTSGAVSVPFLVATTLIFLSMRRFGRLVRIPNSWLASLWPIVAAIVLAIPIIFVPHVDTEIPEVPFDVTNVLNLWMALIVFFAALIVMRTKAVIAQRYQPALSWLVASFWFCIITALHFVVMAIFIPPASWYAQTIWIAYTPGLVSALTFLIAGFTFSRIETVERVQSTSNTPVDVINYMATLASNPQEIDPLLDTLRRITAQLDPRQQKLTKSEESDLAKLYLKLEDYLVTKEPLLHFTVPSLREIITTRFQFAKDTASPFWNVFTEKTKLT